MTIDEPTPGTSPEVAGWRGWDDPERESTSSVALFEGDEGGLELLQRRTLVALLKHRFITGQTHPREWKALTANPRLIRARLNDLFLDLHLDVERQVAFKRQVLPEGGGRFPTLLHDTAWTREETILLVYLRTRSRADDVAGASRRFVDRQDMLEHVASLRPAHATDQAADTRRSDRAIESLNRAGLLLGASTADRFQISPAIDVLLPLERLQELLRWLRSQNSTATEPGTGHEDHDSGEDLL
ncbi:DUF4194 domain-containing protein [Catellatospora methionotrophica]|uniref:DUF4194 domain-containing protein n=1 Tax=Catellatospora methionotrophica TaxID=121620 RepID=UPI0034040EEF